MRKDRVEGVCGGGGGGGGEWGVDGGGGRGWSTLGEWEGGAKVEGVGVGWGGQNNAANVFSIMISC